MAFAEHPVHLGRRDERSVVLRGRLTKTQTQEANIPCPAKKS
jgi:hypothetical protein